MSSNRWRKTRLLANYLKCQTKNRAGRCKRQNKKSKPSLSLNRRGEEDHVQSSQLAYSSIDLGRDANEDDGFNWSSTHEDDGDLHSNEASPRRKRRRTHGSMRAKQLEGWQNIQQILVTTHISSKAMKTEQLCMYCPSFAEYRCRDCSATAYFCEAC